MCNVLQGQLLATCGYLNSLKLGVMNNSVPKSHRQGKKNGGRIFLGEGASYMKAWGYGSANMGQSRGLERSVEARIEPKLQRLFGT